MCNLIELSTLSRRLLRLSFASVAASLSVAAPTFAIQSVAENETAAQSIASRLASTIEQAIKRRYPASASIQIKLRFSKALNHVQVCPVEPVIETKRAISLGTQKWFVRCPTLGWKASAMATSKLSVQAATASKTLKKGHRLQVEDIVLAEVTLTKESRLYYRVEEVVGSKLRRSLKTGDTLNAQRFYLDYDVEKGLPVSLIYHSKTFSLETQGVALEDGQVGDTIAIKNAHSGRQLRGQVVEKNLVRVF
ncbi:flagellar basal-body P-ring formation protein FlgA [Vibrio maritimus]|uniref:Flagella basal body P-ring formation protein FlgA n=1 Tax=Vibrio maritimus TaxID=990268 RepID=A0A090RX97_9VIBR|nr:flagellar basal-body P-ring formation protein FlgA [Vibrio maritimus]